MRPSKVINDVMNDNAGNHEIAVGHSDLIVWINRAPDYSWTCRHKREFEFYLSLTAEIESK